MIPDLLRNARTAASAARTLVYGSVAVTLGIGEVQAGALVDAVVIAAVFADLITWTVRTVMLLPNDIYHGIYDGVVNLLFVAFLFDARSFEGSFDGDVYAFGALTFFIVVIMKAVAYSVQYARYTLGED